MKPPFTVEELLATFAFHRGFSIFYRRTTGRIAGHFRKDRGGMVLCFRRRKYPVTRLAHFLRTGRWTMGRESSIPFTIEGFEQRLWTQKVHFIAKYEARREILASLRNGRRKAEGAKLREI